ncbi:hypothetical protein TKK_0009249 [Trichogramma kaykai]
MIFLEDCISHTDRRVYETPNRDEIFEASYNKIMDFTFEDVDESEPIELLLLSSSQKDKKDPKEVSLSQDDEAIIPSDTESLEVLADYRDIVIPSLVGNNSARKNLQVTTIILKPLVGPILQS